jgi:hypothetical protein
MKGKIWRRLLGAVLTAGLLLSVSAPAKASDSKAGIFTDVPANSWCAGAVAYVSGSGLMKGVSAKQFAPGRTLTRAMFVTVLARMAKVRTDYYGDPGFTDVKSGSWCAGAVAWAAQYGIANGYTSEVFGANGTVTREQAAAMIARAVSLFELQLPESGTATAFADAASVSASAKDGVELMRKTGILQGDAQGNFNPKNGMTRGAAATVFMRLAQAVESVTVSADQNARTLTASGASCTVRERVLLRDFRCDIRYPEISGLASADYQKAWNAIFLKNAEAEKEAVDSEGEILQASFAVPQADAQLLSVTENSYAYVDGGMHGTAMLFTWNFDMATGKQVRLPQRCDTAAIAKALLSGKGWQVYTSAGKPDTSGEITLDSILEMSQCDKTQTAVKALLDQFDSSDSSSLSGYSYWENGNPCLVLFVSHAAGDYCVIKMNAAYPKTA